MLPPYGAWVIEATLIKARLSIPVSVITQGDDNCFVIVFLPLLLIKNCNLFTIYLFHDLFI